MRGPDGDGGVAGRRVAAQRRTGRRGGESGTREAILSAARARFGDLGYDGATIRGIAADAGVDAALVHHFFGTKERLFVAAMRLPLIPGDVIDAALAPGAREPGVGLGEHLLGAFLHAWDAAETRATFLGLLRSAVTSEQAAAMLAEFVTQTILGRIAGVSRTALGGRGPGGGAAAPESPVTRAGPGPGDTGARPAPGGAEPGTGRRPSRPGPGHDGSGDADARFRAALVGSQVLGLALTRYLLRLEPLVEADPEDLAAAIGPTLERYLTGPLR